MRFEDFILNSFSVNNEMDFAERIRGYLENNAIDAEITVSVNGKEIRIKPFREITIGKSVDNHMIKTDIKGELDKRYEEIITAFFYYLTKKREYKIERRLRELMRYADVNTLKLDFDFKEKKALENNPLFQLFRKYKALSEEYKKRYEEHLTFNQLSTFTFFKIMSAEREEYLKEILFFTFNRLLKTSFEFFFLFFEEDELLPTELLFSSNFLDEFFLDNLYRTKIRNRVRKVEYKDRTLYLYYSTLIENEKGVLGVYTDVDLLNNVEYRGFLEYLSTIILYFYLKKRIKFAYSFTRRNLPVINLKAAILRMNADPEIINTLTYPLEKVNIKDIIKEVFELLDFDISRKKINIELDEKDFLVEGDRVLLKIAFSNLFKHLVSFNRIRGYMRISFKQNSIIIEDTGIGLTKNEINLLLDPQSLEEPLCLSGIIFRTLGFDLDIQVERGIGNTIKINV